jgi:glycosyltransferase involved in cell wall biosynthesis
MNKHRFTIVISTHNRPVLLRRTLLSLAAQTFQDFFVIIVDDAGSFLPPYQELQQLEGRFAYVIAPSFQGPGESRDMAVKIANSDYVMFLDDDDTYQPDHLENINRQVDPTSTNIYFTNFTVVNEERSDVAQPDTISQQSISISNATKEDIYVLNRIPNCCLVYPQEAISALQHDYSMKVYEDWDYLLQCMATHDLQHLSIDTVNIHKCEPKNENNFRRGNMNNEHIYTTTAMLHQRYAAPNERVTQARDALMSPQS